MLFLEQTVFLNVVEHPQQKYCHSACLAYLHVCQLPDRLRDVLLPFRVRLGSLHLLLQALGVVQDQQTLIVHYLVVYAPGIGDLTVVARHACQREMFKLGKSPTNTLTCDTPLLPSLNVAFFILKFNDGVPVQVLLQVFTRQKVSLQHCY